MTEFPIHYDGEVLPLPCFFGIDDELHYGEWALCNSSYSFDSRPPVMWVGPEQSRVTYKDNLCWGMRWEHDKQQFLQAATIIKMKIQKHIKKDIRLCKIHVNGQTFGQIPTFHKDFIQDWVWTFVLFTNMEWNKEWGGEFICTKDDKYYHYPYVPNRGVLIPSNWEHRGASPNNSTDKLRTTIGFSYVQADKWDELIDSLASTSKTKSRFLS